MSGSNERSRGTVAGKAAAGVAFLALVVLLILWLAGTFHRKVDDAAPPSATARVQRRAANLVNTVPVRSIQMPRAESAVGTIRAVHESAIASKLLAKVEAVSVRAGQQVAEGEVLIRLDDADLRARFAQAQAAADSARAARDQALLEHQRVGKLHAEGAAAKIEWDRVQTALQAAEAELSRTQQAGSEAQTILDYAIIRSPIVGTVIDKKVEVGDTVTPGQVLLTLYDPTRMQLVASVRESLTQRLSIGQTVEVEVDALKKRCAGRISEIVPEAEAASRTFSVKVTGPCPTGIYSGMFGRLLIPLDQEEVTVVPRSAVRQVGQLDMVDVVVGDTLQLRAVQLGRPFDESVEVLAGLRPGEFVAAEAPALESQP